MKQLCEILKLATEHLEKQSVRSPRLSAEELLAHVLKLKRIELYMQYDRPLIESELDQFRECIKRRSKHEPSSYIMKEIDFFHCQLTVTPSVLIPRPETEIFVERIYKHIKSESDHKVAWDLCTGSGAIAISLKKKLTSLQVFGSDLSESALAIAQENASRNQVPVPFYQGDLLNPFLGQKADFVICNPPYVSEKEYATLDPEIGFEPKMALVSGITGLEFYARLARELPPYLNRGAKLFFEIGRSQGESIKEFFNAPCWKAKWVEKDWAGHDRFFFLEFE